MRRKHQRRLNCPVRCISPLIAETNLAPSCCSVNLREPGTPHGRFAEAAPRANIKHMRIGFSLPNGGPLASAETIVAIARRAEDLAYDTLWTFERLLYPVRPRDTYPRTPDGSWPPLFRRMLDPLETLAFAAAQTNKVHLGTSVLNIPFYNPVTLARRLTSIDYLSGGRLRVGFGLGWSKDEMEATGADMSRRGARSPARRWLESGGVAARCHGADVFFDQTNGGSGRTRSCPPRNGGPRQPATHGETPGERPPRLHRHTGSDQRRYGRVPRDWRSRGPFRSRIRPGIGHRRRLAVAYGAVTADRLACLQPLWLRDHR